MSEGFLHTFSSRSVPGAPPGPGEFDPCDGRGDRRGGGRAAGPPGPDPRHPVVRQVKKTREGGGFFLPLFL